jgi:diacylglycerol kinase family enzyme
MKHKKAYLTIHPRAGQNLAKLPDIIPVLLAAAWKTKIRIKEYGGHAIEIATRAAEE